MIENVKGFFQKHYNKIKKRCLKNVNTLYLVLCGYFASLATSVSAYLILWINDYVHHTAKFADLLALIHELISAQMLLAVTFVVKFLIDANKNGIPDEFEKEDVAPVIKDIKNNIKEIKSF